MHGHPFAGGTKRLGELRLSHAVRQIGAEFGGAIAALDRGDVQPLVRRHEVNRATAAGRIHQAHVTEDIRRVSPPIVAFSELCISKRAIGFVPVCLVSRSSLFSLAGPSKTAPALCPVILAEVGFGGVFPCSFDGSTMPNGFETRLKCILNLLKTKYKSFVNFGFR